MRQDVSNYRVDVILTAIYEFILIEALRRGGIDLEHIGSVCGNEMLEHAGAQLYKFRNKHNNFTLLIAAAVLGNSQWINAVWVLRRAL